MVETIHRIIALEDKLLAIEAKLDRVLAYVEKVDSKAYRDNEDAKAMVLNLVADIFTKDIKK